MRHRPPAAQAGLKGTFSEVHDQAAIGVNMIVATAAAFGIGYYFAAYYNLDRPSVSTPLATATVL
jgi:hypothetical protein